MEEFANCSHIEDELLNEKVGVASSSETPKGGNPCNIIETADDDDDNDDLDVSWIQDEERIQNIQTIYCREPTVNITLFFIYINQHQYIDKIVSEKHNFPAGNSNISKEEMLHIIEKRKISTPFSKYKLADILKFHVNLEPEHIQQYSRNENIGESSKEFFKVLPILDEIAIDPSIFIFHSLNSVFFIFQEVLKTGSHSHTLKSILKSDCKRTIHKSTKKVRIDVLPKNGDNTASIKISNKSGYQIRTTRKNRAP